MRSSNMMLWDQQLTVVPKISTGEIWLAEHSNAFILALSSSKHHKALRHHQSDLLDLAQRACAVKSQGSGIENGFGNSQIVASRIFRTRLVIVTAFYTYLVSINAIHSGSRYSVFSPSKLGEPPRRIKLGNPAAMKSIYKTRYSVRLRRQGMLLQYLKNDY